MNSRSCIYCSLATYDPSDEHIVQDAFGAKMCLTSEVCSECNKFFSPLDGDLANFVRRYALAADPEIGRDLLRGKITLALDPEHGTFFACSHARSGERIPLTQILVRQGTHPLMLLGDAERARVMMKELMEPTGISIESVEWLTPDGELPANAIVARSRERKYVVCAKDKNFRSSVTRLVSSGKMGELLVALSPGSQQTDRRVESELVTFMEQISDVNRPMAKIAFNFACKCFGHSAMLRSEFDGMRSYIRYGVEGGGVEIFSAEARERVRTEPLMKNLCATRSHKLFMVGVPGRPLQVHITLYGYPFAIIQLLDSPATSWIDEEIYLGVFAQPHMPDRILRQSSDFDEIVALVRGQAHG